jgi:hypothetical protein
MLPNIIFFLGSYGGISKNRMPTPRGIPSFEQVLNFLKCPCFFTFSHDTQLRKNKNKSL